jgi:thiamine-phosphate pyrophosphorylase
MSTPPLLPSGLYVLCDDTLLPSVPLAQAARWLLAGRPAVLQLRLKRTPAREAVGVAREVVALCRAAAVPCIINDRVDWALLAGADGAHVGEEDLPVAEARSLLGPDRLLGATVRSLEELLRAREAGADHVGFGPVFPTSTKQVPATPLGLEGLAAVCAQTPLPVVAIAGIHGGNIAGVAAAGAHCAAVVSAPFAGGCDAPSVEAAVRALCAGFDKGRALRSVPPL